MKWCERKLIVGPYMTLCFSEKEFRAAMRRIKAPEPFPPFVTEGYGATTHIVRTSRGLVTVIGIDIPKKCDLIEVHGLLLHEAVHVWQAFVRDINEDHPSDEFEAYSIQMLAQELFKAYRAAK